MNTTKRIALSALALGLLLTLAALPGAWAETDSSGSPDSTTLQEQQAHLWLMRSIMHNATFTPEVTSAGVTVSMTAENPALVAAIRAEFAAESGLQSPLPGSTVTATPTEGGLALSFISDDPVVVSTLQAYGNGLAYALLRNHMHAVMWSAQGTAGSFGPGYGPQGSGLGMMGPGFGPGMMGPGMMGPGYGPQGSGPGMMGPGFGPGMMGPGYGPQGSGPQGSGPGWMHGRGGMMGGYGPGWGYGPQGPQGPAPEANPR